MHLSGGDITAVSAGTGLSGGGTQGSVTLSLDTLPHGKALQATAQTVPNSEITQVNFDTLELSSEVTLANNELTVTTPGVYSVTGSIIWGVNGTGGRHIHLAKNGTFITGSVDNAQAAPTSLGATVHSVTTLARFDANDTIQMFAVQNSGGNLLTFPVSGAGAVLSAHWVSP